jgi:hypothetical protein
MAHSRPMITDTDQQGDSDNRAPDLEYDLVHDTDPAEVTPAAGRSRPVGDAVQVVPRDVDPQGDYGYDLAHEVICR